MIEFRVTIDPVPCLRPRLSRRRTYNPPKYDRFKRDFSALAREHRPDAPLNGPLEMEMEFGLVPPKRLKPTSKRSVPSVRPDLDNYIKAVNDSLEGFFVDDGQIVKLTARKVYAWDRKPYIAVRIVKPSASTPPPRPE